MKQPINLKEQYPEIAAMTVEDIVNSEEFDTQLKRVLKSFDPRVGVHYYAYKSLLNAGFFKLENFKKEYIACIDGQSHLTFAKRVVIYFIGNNAYSKTIKQLMKQHDEKLFCDNQSSIEVEPEKENEYETE